MQYYILSRGRSVDLLGGVDLDVVNAGRVRYSLDGYGVLACAQKDGGESDTSEAAPLDLAGLCGRNFSCGHAELSAVYRHLEAVAEAVCVGTLCKGYININGSGLFKVEAEGEGRTLVHVADVGALACEELISSYIITDTVTCVTTTMFIQPMPEEKP